MNKKLFSELIMSAPYGIAGQKNRFLKLIDGAWLT